MKLSCVDDYFLKFLTSKQNIPLVEGMDEYSMDFKIEFVDLKQIWSIKVNSGKIVFISADEKTFSEKVRFIVNEDIFWQIVNNQISPQKAFFMRKTDIKGNLFEGMKLAKILSAFFEKYNLVECYE